MKRMGILLGVLVMVMGFCAFFVQSADAVTYYSRQNGNWTNNNTWSSASCGGVSAGATPTAADDVQICAGHTVTMNGNPGAANSLTIIGTAAWANPPRTTNIGIGGITVNSGGNITGVVAGVLTTTGNLTINADTTSTTVTVTMQTTGGQTISGTGSLGSLAINSTTTNNGNLTVTTGLSGGSALTNGVNATLNIGGTSTITTLTATAAGNTVNYSGAGAQTVKATTYNNLTLSGSGAKSMATGTSANGILSIAPSGTATASVGAGLNLSVNSLTLGGLGRVNGTWGGTGSGATYINTAYFAATTGYLTVATDTRTTPTVSIWPTASGITYGQALSASALTGGSASVSGSFAFTAPSTVPSAGTYSASVTFTPTDTTSYRTVIGSVNVAVAKANSIVTTWPTASAITYGQTLGDSTLSGGVATPAGSFAFTNPATAPNAGTALRSVTYTPTDTANYNSAAGTVSVTVVKANSVVTTWPTASAITYGQTLGDSTLSGGVATPAGSFAWTTPTTAPAVGTASHSVTYTPTDTANYNSATGTVSVTVLPAVTDITPDPFTFAPQSGVALSTPVTSNSVTITGIDAPSPISIVGGQYSINNGPFTSLAGTISNGNSVKVQCISSGSYSTTTSATLTIGGVNGIFNVTTMNDPGPIPVGYSPMWLFITMLSLTLFGGYLLRKRISRT